MCFTSAVCVQPPGTHLCPASPGNASGSVLGTRRELAWLPGWPVAQHSLLSESCSPFPLGPEQPHSLKPGYNQGFHLLALSCCLGVKAKLCKAGQTKHRRQSGYSQHCIKKVDIISLFQKNRYIYLSQTILKCRFVYSKLRSTSC